MYINRKENEKARKLKKIVEVTTEKMNIKPLLLFVLLNVWIFLSC